MAKNDNAWTRSLSRINLKIIFLQNYQFFMNYAKGPVKIHWLEAEKITFDPWRNFRGASLIIVGDSLNTLQIELIDILLFLILFQLVLGFNNKNNKII